MDEVRVITRESWPRGVGRDLLDLPPRPVPPERPHVMIVVGVGVASTIAGLLVVGPALQFRVPNDGRAVADY